LAITPPSHGRIVFIVLALNFGPVTRGKTIYTKSHLFVYLQMHYWVECKYLTQFVKGCLTFCVPHGFHLFFFLNFFFWCGVSFNFIFPLFFTYFVCFMCCCLFSKGRKIRFFL
jgi:hypothetical protein